MRFAVLFFLASAIASFAQDSNSTIYPAHAERFGTQIGAKRVSAKDLSRAFIYDLKKCCVVVEVLLSPKQGETLPVTLADFSLRVSDARNAVPASDRKRVAAALDRPMRPSSDRDIDVVQTAQIGYESRRYDPITGMERPGGVYTGAGVGVGVGRTGRAASTVDDNQTFRQELDERALPEGNVAAPVMGYIFFMTTPKKDAALQLEYMLNGEKMVLSLPKL